ncbi:hypothetical protein D9T17_02945 [Lysobacter enzymogenes]|uniref:Probable zinc-binding domain-containing protein n=1 Tax=Lysobacter enzymogenes TaxID=69 RepID=A0A3N2RMS6_LYSEN|nr:hypothetical protein D9T17_02945 [Lysobacter enzymogenes]
MPKRKNKKPGAGPAAALNRSRWSQASRRSVACELAGDHYLDRPSTCRNCGDGFVFTAQQQREAYEVRKAYIWQQRVLCAPCWQQRVHLVGELKRIRSRWARERASVKRDPQALRQWRDVLAQLPRYGLREDRAQRAMVDRLWATAARIEV